MRGQPIRLDRARECDLLNGAVQFRRNGIFATERERNMRKCTKLPGLMLGIGLLAVLAGCAGEPEECEPGVSNISEMATVTAPGC